MSESLSILLHPLVVMNMSDHYTRAKYREKINPIRVVGVILGRQEARNLEIVNSIEVKFDMPNGTDITIDENFMRQRIEAYKKMYVDLDCIGWYSVTHGQGANGDKPFE
mmetsp:Transcript_15523/g.10892  ORF Transcript_15523/g.10892 Transcript_15523/m.10892 type:complete len:109 (+) Transcript_15523:59-385(+)|eukprot:CAMPEP_0116873368 /NCGR_PEP_ID=MMETSP0463-20121206/4425_1 /TAXON_ID=181622 /ORGANISM="Strombidinopsis sp, Strain SopsisLIS2011" /LENGTH=108 /DNA_ID=CAMNT_0004515133 /DNA_START=1 /DNA_END=327 /DNA_ORIENTATION=-